MTMLITGLFLIGLSGLIVHYYKTIEKTERFSTDFRSDGQLHLIYPES